MAPLVAGVARRVSFIASPDRARSLENPAYLVLGGLCRRHFVFLFSGEPGAAAEADYCYIPTGTEGLVRRRYGPRARLEVGETPHPRPAI
jgi:hypothetical protein